MLVLMAAFFGFQHWLAAGNDMDHRAQLAALGVTGDWTNLVPQLPPDDRNFFMHPLVQAWIPPKGAGRSSSANNDWGIGRPSLPPGFDDTPTLDELARLDRSKLDEIEAWFAAWDESLAEFRNAGRRPHAMLPGNYTSPELAPLPDLVTVRTISKALATRARLHLLLGRTDAALEDLDSLWVMLKAVDTKPATLVSAMIRCAVGALGIGVVEDGFARQLWQPGDLAPLQARLLSLDFLGSFSDAVDSERKVMVFVLERLASSLKSERESAAELLAFGSSWEASLLPFLPERWVRQNQLLGAQLLQEAFGAIDPQARRYHPQKALAYAEAAERATGRKHPGNFLMSVFLPNLTKASAMAARTQARFDMGAIHCALERHRQAQGELPASLHDLAPAFMDRVPNDLATGELPFYRRGEKGRFELYCAGENAADDGGAGDDWVWLKPAATTNAASGK
jgi:hypothetical protein